MGRDPIERDEQTRSEARIAALTRELAEAINEGKPLGRTEARDYAIDLLRDEVEATPAPEPREGRPPGPLNPFALGIPLLLVGVILLPLFGVMGLAMAGIGAFMCVLGVAIAITGRRRGSSPGGG